MRSALVLSSLLVLAGCQCGPGVSCKADSDCGGWGHCSAATGYCVTNGSNGGGGGGSAGGGGGASGGGAGGGAIDAGAPEAVLSATAVDLGDAGCGTTVSQQVKVINNGTAPLTFTTSIDNVMDFAVTPGGTVDPMSMGAVTVSATPRSLHDANTPLAATLTVLTNDPAKPRFDLPVSYTTFGVTLGLEPAQVSFGVRPVGSVATQPVTLKNTGNVDATVTLGQPNDDQFALDAGVVTVPASQQVAVMVSFDPTTTTSASSFSPLSVAQPVCGLSSVSRIDLSGQGTNGKVGLSTSDVSFGANGLVDCGSRAGDQTFTLSNFGTAAYSWSGALGKGASSPFTVTPSSGTVPANMSVTITVSTAAIPSQASTMTDAFGDTFTLTTDAAGDTAHVVNLHQTAQGASLSFNPGSVDFGQVPANNTANAPFSVVNSGNGRVAVSLSTDNAAFTLAPSGSSQLGPGSLSVVGTFSPDGSVTPQTANVGLSVDGGVLCSPLPLPLSMSGTGTMGSVSYSPVALDFGLVDCGATAAAGTVIFSNFGNQAYTLTPALALGGSSPYSLSMSPDSGVVAADGGTVSITVTPAAVPFPSAVTPNLYGDTLTVTTDISGDQPHDIALRETAHGAIFALSAQTIDFGSVPKGVNQTALFSLTNSGNAPGTLDFSLSPMSVFSLPASVTVGAASSKQASAGFAPLAVMSYSDNGALAVASGTVLCQPLPFASMTLKGVGTNQNVVDVSPASLTFGTNGLVDCGATAPAKAVTVTNNSSQTLSLSYALAAGAGSPYTVSGPGSVAMGAMATVTLTPKAIPSTSATTADGYADTLTITAAGGSVNESHTVALHQTAQGAILSFNPSSLSFSAGVGATDTKNFTVNNAGNVSAAFTLTVGGSNANLFSVSPTSGSSPAGGSSTETASFSPGLNLGSKSAKVSLSTTVNLCAPLPADLTLTGN